MTTLPGEAAPAILAKVFGLQVFWPTEAGFREQDAARTMVPARGEMTRYFVELPATAAGLLRIDPGSEPGVWWVGELAVYDVDTQGTMVDPPALHLGAGNNFAGLGATSGVLMERRVLAEGQEVCQWLCWDNDPQLQIAIPPANPGAIGRVLALTCRAMTPAELLLRAMGAQVFGERVELLRRCELLTAQIRMLQQVETELGVQRTRAERAEADGGVQRVRAQSAERELQAIQASRWWRFSRPLVRLYHRMCGRGGGPPGAGS